MSSVAYKIEISEMDNIIVNWKGFPKCLFSFHTFLLFYLNNNIYLVAIVFYYSHPCQCSHEVECQINGIIKLLHDNTIT